MGSGISSKIKLWLKWLGASIAGILIVVGVSMIGKDGRRLEKAQKEREENLRINTDASRKKAEEAGKLVKKHAEGAKIAADVTQKTLDKLGKNDATTREMLNSWNSKRVQ